MRRLAMFLGALALVAGCSSGTGPTAGPSAAAVVVPASAPSASPAPTPSSVPTPSAPTATTVNGRVSFDGTHCSYEGLDVIPAPAALTLEYRVPPALDTAMLFVVAVNGSVTDADLAAADNPDVGSGVPWFALEDTFHAQTGSSTSVYDLRIVQRGGATYDRYFVACLPTFPGQPVGGYKVLQLVGDAAP